MATGNWTVFGSFSAQALAQEAWFKNPFGTADFGASLPNDQDLLAIRRTRAAQHSCNQRHKPPLPERSTVGGMLVSVE